MYDRRVDAPGAATAFPLLATKLAPPALRSGNIARPHLIEQLEQSNGRTLVLVSAPAGFGKTTLLVNWLANVERKTQSVERQDSAAAASTLRFAWLTLDPEDNDPARFWAYVIAALRRADPVLAERLPELPGGLHTPAPALIAADLINALAATPRDLALILDDYHHIAAQPIHESLAFLIEHLPPGVRLVLAGRADPPLPMARLRARDLLVELRAADLRFNSYESSSFLRETMRLEATPEALAALAEHAEGWPAGLQLAALSLRGGHAIEARIAAIAGGDRYILDYLAEEVLNRQSSELQFFLLHTSILDQFCAELCDAVLDDGQPAVDVNSNPTIQRPASSILDQLEHANLFLVSLDERREWYRYHTLFGEMLRHRLQREAGVARVAALHRRASAWYARRAAAGDGAATVAAIKHALASGNFDEAADLIEPVSDTLWMRGELALLLRWLAALPDATIRARPRLCMTHAWALFLHDRQDIALQRLAEAEQALASGEPSNLLSGLLAAMRGAVATTRDRPEEILTQTQRALALIPSHEQVWRGVLVVNLGLAQLTHGEAHQAAQTLLEAAEISRETGNDYLLMIALWHLARARIAQGCLSDAERAYQLMAGDERRVWSALSGYRDVGLGALAYQRNSLADAAGLIERGLHTIGTAGQPRVIAYGHIYAALVARASGDHTRTRDELDHTEAFARRLGLADVLATLAMLRARLAIADGDLALAEMWARAAHLSPDDLPDPAHEEIQLTFTRLLIARDEPRPALRMLDRMLALARIAGRQGSVLEIETLRALALTRLGQSADALDLLTRTLKQAEPQGYIRLFVVEGQPMAELLNALESYPPAAGLRRYLGELRSALTDDTSVEVGAVSTTTHGLPAAPLIEPLSERELRVLRLLVAGRSNQEIASDLIVSVNTVKTHIKRIYDKLQVNSRIAAAERARTLDLL